ncbi:MAG: hypothetical protein N838_09465 [Thiohalocapsa sp. PB-PSB1]|nr:MAG: hypothetical protein N838_09465 [Thiohalocapsa sp. PB-PSB1]
MAAVRHRLPLFRDICPDFVDSIRGNRDAEIPLPYRLDRSHC